MRARKEREERAGEREITTLERGWDWSIAVEINEKSRSARDLETRVGENTNM